MNIIGLELLKKLIWSGILWKNIIQNVVKIFTIKSLLNDKNNCWGHLKTCKFFEVFKTVFLKNIFKKFKIWSWRFFKKFFGFLALKPQTNIGKTVWKYCKNYTIHENELLENVFYIFIYNSWAGVLKKK